MLLYGPAESNHKGDALLLRRAPNCETTVGGTNLPGSVR